MQVPGALVNLHEEDGFAQVRRLRNVGTRHQASVVWMTSVSGHHCRETAEQSQGAVGASAEHLHTLADVTVHGLISIKRPTQICGCVKGVLAALTVLCCNSSIGTPSVSGKLSSGLELMLLERSLLRMVSVRRTVHRVSVRC